MGGLERFAAEVGQAAGREGDWSASVSSGLRAGLEFLAADPQLARLLLVESLDPAGPGRSEYEDALRRLAEALRPPAGLVDGKAVSDETLRLLAGGLVSHATGRVLAGEAERLPEDHDLLLEFLARYTF